MLRLRCVSLVSVAAAGVYTGGTSWDFAERGRLTSLLSLRVVMSVLGPLLAVQRAE